MSRGASLAVVLLVTSCGSRTSLSAYGEPCGDDGETRACADACGSGIERCSAGVWQRCEVPRAKRACSSLCGTGNEFCEEGRWQGCDAPVPKAPRLRATVRDFNDTHPDFEKETSFDPGIVEDELGADDKPVYAAHTATLTTHGKTSFDQWYRDVMGINLRASLEIPLVPSPGSAAILQYDNDAFFPIDGQLFGNQGRLHNYHFTVELVTEFRYAGGETFRFKGDDDMWVFVNRHLAIDLGGVHPSREGEVELDRDRQKLGIVPDQVYPLHLFFAERHTRGSTFHIATTIAEFDACD